MSNNSCCTPKIINTGGAFDPGALTPAQIAQLQALLNLPENHITNIVPDLQPTGNPNEYTVTMTWLDEDGNPQSSGDATPIIISNENTICIDKYCAATSADTFEYSVTGNDDGNLSQTTNTTAFTINNPESSDITFDEISIRGRFTGAGISGYQFDIGGVLTNFASPGAAYGFQFLTFASPITIPAGGSAVVTYIGTNGVEFSTSSGSATVEWTPNNINMSIEGTIAAGEEVFKVITLSDGTQKAYDSSDSEVTIGTNITDGTWTLCPSDSAVTTKIECYDDVSVGSDGNDSQAEGIGQFAVGLGNELPDQSPTNVVLIRYLDGVGGNVVHTQVGGGPYPNLVSSQPSPPFGPIVVQSTFASQEPAFEAAEMVFATATTTWAVAEFQQYTYAPGSFTLNGAAPNFGGGADLIINAPGGSSGTGPYSVITLEDGTQKAFDATNTPVAIDPAWLPCPDGSATVLATPTPFTTTNNVDVEAGGFYILFEDGNTWASSSGGTPFPIGPTQCFEGIAVGAPETRGTVGGGNAGLRQTNQGGWAYSPATDEVVTSIELFTATNASWPGGDVTIEIIEGTTFGFAGFPAVGSSDPNSTFAAAGSAGLQSVTYPFSTPFTMLAGQDYIFRVASPASNTVLIQEKSNITDGIFSTNTPAEGIGVVMDVTPQSLETFTVTYYTDGSATAVDSLGANVDITAGIPAGWTECADTFVGPVLEGVAVTAINTIDSLTSNPDLTKAVKVYLNGVMRVGNDNDGFTIGMDGSITVDLVALDIPSVETTDRIYVEYTPA